MPDNFNKEKAKKIVFSIIKQGFIIDSFLREGQSEYGKPSINQGNLSIKGELVVGVVKSAGNEELKYKLFNDIDTWLMQSKIPLYKDLDTFTIFLFNKKIKVSLVVKEAKFTLKVS